MNESIWRPGRREVALGGVLDGLLELLAVEVELLDRQRADDRAQRALEDVLDDRVDLLLLGFEEPLGGVPDRLVVGADLERRDALDRDLDALPRHGVGEVHVDLAGGQLELADLVEERQDDDALPPRTTLRPCSPPSERVSRWPDTTSASFAPATL